MGAHHAKLINDLKQRSSKVIELKGGDHGHLELFRTAYDLLEEGERFIPDEWTVAFQILNRSSDSYESLGSGLSLDDFRLSISPRTYRAIFEEPKGSVDPQWVEAILLGKG